MMLIMLIASILLATSFLGVAIWRERALPESISALVYVFSWKWLWTLWLWIVSFLTLMPVIERLSRIGMEFLGFGTLACLVFCGAMPLFDKDNLSKHWEFGIAGCMLSQMCVWVIGYQWLATWMIFPFLFLSSYIQPDGWLGKAMKGKGVLIAEVICYVALTGSLIERYV